MKKCILFFFCLLFFAGISCKKEEPPIIQPPPPEKEKPLLELKYVDYEPRFVYVGSDISIFGESQSQFNVYHQSLIESTEVKYQGHPTIVLDAKNTWIMPTSSIGETISWEFHCVACDTLYWIEETGTLKITEKGPNIIYVHLNRYQFKTYL